VIGAILFGRWPASHRLWLCRKIVDNFYQRTHEVENREDGRYLHHRASTGRISAMKTRYLYSVALSRRRATNANS